MKAILLLALCYLYVQGVYTPIQRQNNQEALTGAYEFNQLQEPQHVSNCGDDAIQIDIFNFVGYMLNKADNASLFQLLTLKKEVDNYFNSLPEDYTNCLYSEPEFAEITTLYGLKEDDKFEVISDKIYQYAANHFIASKKEIHKGNVYWNQDQNYHAAGYLIADFSKRALLASIEQFE